MPQMAVFLILIMKDKRAFKHCVEQITRNWMYLLAATNTHICVDSRGMEWYRQAEDILEV